jgi:RNA polymerase sigma-70 factor (ECF subfamily)
MNTLGTAAAACAPISDAALACSIVAGEPGAFERLMRQHNRRLFRVARSILRDDAEAEDALQEGYIKAHRAMAGFRGDARLSTWLTRIIVNQALESRRRRPVEAAEQTGGEPVAENGFGNAPETPETLAMRNDLRRLIERAIDDLPDNYRNVFMLRAVEGLSVDETAASLGITEANTKVRHLRARALLRESLGQRLGPLLENVFAFDGHRCDRIVAHVCARLGLPAPAVAGQVALPSPTPTRSAS